MNIGIDIDDTITYTYETYLPLVAIRFKLDLNTLLKQKPTYRYLSKTLPDYEEFAKDSFSSIARLAPVREGASEYLTKLKEEGYHITMITARNYEEFEDPYKVCLEYLTIHKIPFDKIIVNAEDKVKECILNNIDIFIDDKSLTCKKVQEAGIKTLYFKTSFNKKCKNLHRVKNWEEAYKIIHDVSK